VRKRKKEEKPTEETERKRKEKRERASDILRKGRGLSKRGEKGGLKTAEREREGERTQTKGGGDV